MGNQTGIFIFYGGAFGFSLGIFIRSLFDVGLPEATWILLLVVGVLVLVRLYPASPYGGVIFLAAIFFGAVGLGLLRLEVATWHELSPKLEHQLKKATVLTGVIVREPDVREVTSQLFVDTDYGLVLVIVDTFASYAYGDRVEVRGVLSKPEAFVTDLGRTFNYPGYLKARGVTYQLPFSEVTVIEHEQGNPVIAGLFALKQQFMQSVEASIPEPAAGLGEGLLLGVKRALGSELEVAFRRTGIIHIVVLSGYNVMLVVAFVLYLLSRFVRSRLQVAFGIAAIAGFAILVGLSATVVRASIMAVLLLVLQATGHTYIVLRALVVAGIGMLMINPYLLVYDVGFQLSFIATMGLIILAPWLVERFTIVPRSIGIRDFLVATIATQIFVMPLLLYQIGEFSVVSVLVNILVLPIVPVAMLLTFLTGLLGLVSITAALPLAYLTYVSLTYIILIATWFAALPFAAFVVPAFPFWLVPISYCVGGYFLYRVCYPKEADQLRQWTLIEEEDFIRSLKTRP